MHGRLATLSVLREARCHQFLPPDSGRETVKHVEVYWSHQSPYCYFSLDRILSLRQRHDVTVSLRLVLPGVLRNAGKFTGASEIEQRYFALDSKRTAHYLGIPYGIPCPWPVECEPGTLYRAEPDQPRVFGLYHLNQVAIELGSGLDFLDVVARLIWNGATTNWHEESTMCSAIERAGLDYDLLSRRVGKAEQTYMRIYAENAETLHASGHWGVPVFVYKGEPFYGQDRFDQLVWRLDH